jgi:deoxyribose-phosphate aldolase
MDPEPRPPLATYEHLAARLMHRFLRPELSAPQVIEGLHLARRLGVASVAVRPCDIELTVRHLDGSAVTPVSVVGFPHGSQTTAAKLFEARDLLRRGAREIAVAAGVAHLLAREFQHVQTELAQIADACHKEGARCTAILDNGWLTSELKIIALRCCESAGVDCVSTSTGFGPSEYSLDDLRLMRKYLPEETAVAAGGVSSLANVLEAYDAGATRFASEHTAAILEEWKTRLSAEAPGA